MFTFGLRPPDGKNPKYWWGARAIFTNKWNVNHNRRKRSDPDLIQFVEVALLYDRQSYSGPDKGEEGAKALFNWIDYVGLPKVREWAKGVLPSDNLEFKFSSSSFNIIASPRASYGYMYIGAWSDEERMEDNGAAEAQG
jgi:hypothetical protein